MSEKITKITIAQAIRRVNKLKGLISEHQDRALIAISYQSDAIPAFNFADSVKAAEDCTAELLALQTRIAFANSTTFLEFEGEKLPLSFAVRILQELKGRISFYNKLVLRSGVVKNRVSDWDDDLGKSISRVEEITWISDLTEVARDSLVKKLQDRFESLNNLVEDTNHQTSV